MTGNVRSDAERYPFSFPGATPTVWSLRSAINAPTLNAADGGGEVTAGEILGRGSGSAMSDGKAVKPSVKAAVLLLVGDVATEAPAVVATEWAAGSVDSMFRRSSARL